MNLATAMLYPIMLLLPAAGVVDNGHSGDESGFDASGLPEDGAGEADSRKGQTPPEFVPDMRPMFAAWPFTLTAFQSVGPESASQVHIERRMTIRITPRAGRPPLPDMFVALPEGEGGPQFSERKIGKCLSSSGIAGVQPDGGNRLLLFMRDRRIISAELERACRARDFYSGFYLARTADGQLCVDRDTLLSRSGMNCKLTRIRQLVESGH